MLLNISLVTKALQTLLKAGITASPDWPPAVTLDVSALPPDRLKELGDALGVYMFHLSEDPYFKNAPPPGAGASPVATTPTTLRLSYLLTANSKSTHDEASFFEQHVMGLAVKTLHDTPVIDDSTIVGGVVVLPIALRGLHNRFRITLEPVSYSDAPHYWTAGQQPLRLAAYYQVGVAMLEPEPAGRFAPPVLRYGVFAFARTGPRLDSSASTVTFTTPEDGVVHTVEVRPAQVPLLGVVRFIGSGLRGEATTLTLSYPFWDAPIDAGPAWNVIASDTEVAAIVQPQIGTPAQSIVPGIYSASVTVRETRALPDGSSKSFLHRSNEMPFSIAPRIDAIGAFDVLKIATVTGESFSGAPLIKTENVVVLVGFERLVHAPALPLDPGTFRVVDAQHLTFRLPALAAAGERLLLRVLVNGVESAPHWVTAP